MCPLCGGCTVFFIPYQVELRDMQDALDGVCVTTADLNHLQLLVKQPTSHDSHMT